MTGRILVLGASGHVGRPLVRDLLARGAAVKAASRSGQSVEGAEGVPFDFARPDFAAAFEGVDRAYVLLPGGYVNSRELLTPVIEAAAAREVKVVLQTALGVDADDSIPYRQVELALIASGAPYVILRPNWFTDNFLNFWKPGIDHAGAIAVPAGEGKTSFVDARDVAAGAASALTTDRFDGQAINLTGPQALGYAEAAEILSAVIGKPVSYAPVDDDTFVGILTGAGVGADYARFLATIFHPVREGWTAGVTDAVNTLTGQEPRSVAQWAQDNADALRA
ncbi:SDR family oxidoreductase [Ancylobacter dichloromethanicus]|uniref:NAD(P)-dependent oxidoreductase n=1 Tax=Ancylobacter dichloromethanicus TaxID=518825 RepID=A0A9W6J9F7_9HYPH|nr:SDR family oxidoreductase [Ancylobacter dichloromethanicus]MBS7555773.1 SDR family oxidoreductase [Ancylobacter dichloromethanicus]GLK72847.1 NAD(P)-dependent oxidoreductase [Ancylobacter dichloromethanicus]